MEDLIAVRIKDGIFAGNSGAAADKTFLIMNKITHIINCAGAEVGDLFLGEPGFSYLSFPWKDAAGSVCTTILFDAADDNIKRTVQFIDEALAAGECVLVHSVYGKSRSPALIAAYLIMKYGWKLESALLYLSMAHPDADIKPHFQRQLRQFAKRHDCDRDVFAQDVDDSYFGLDNDQWMLRNTLLNGLLYDSQMANGLYKRCTEKVDVGTPVGAKSGAKPRITFVDTKKGVDVESKATCPVVNATTPFHADPATTGGDPSSFIGLRGATSVRAGRRSPSILSRSTSPCERRLESDPRSCPKGRQTLIVVHSGATETGTASASGKVERPPSLRTGAQASRTHSSSSHLSDRDRPKSPREYDSNASFLSQPRQASLESTRSIDYSRLAPPTQVRSPFANLASSHKYRNGSPLPLPKEKKGSSGKGGDSRTKIASSPSSKGSGNTSPVPPPQTASGVVHRAAPPTPPSAVTPNSTASATTNAAATVVVSSPTPIRATVRSSSPLGANKPSREVVVGRPSVASYRGIAPSRTAVNSRPPPEVVGGSLTAAAVRSAGGSRTGSRTTSPSKQSVHTNDNGSEAGNGSRRRTLSPAHQPTAKRTSSNGKRKHGSTSSNAEEKPHGRTRSPKGHRHRDATSRSLNSSFSSLDSASAGGVAGGGAASKNPATVRRQPPPAIASGRK